MRHICDCNNRIQMRSYYLLLWRSVVGYISGLIMKLKIVFPGFKTTVDGAKITWVCFPFYLLRVKALLKFLNDHCSLSSFFLPSYSVCFSLHHYPSLSSSADSSVLLKMLIGLPCWYELIFKLVPSKSLRGFKRLVFLDHIPPLPPMGKGARLFVGFLPSVSTVSWLPVHQEQNNLR